MTTGLVFSEGLPILSMTSLLVIPLWIVPSTIPLDNRSYTNLSLDALKKQPEYNIINRNKREDFNSLSFNYPD